MMVSLQTAVRNFNVGVDRHGFRYAGDLFIVACGMDDRHRKVLKEHGYLEGIGTVNQARKEGIKVPFGYTINAIVYRVNTDMLDM